MEEDFKNSELYKNIFIFHNSVQNRLISRESGWLEFKESFNWNSKDKYAKSMIAFSNNKGGCIVFGVKDTPRDLMGLKSDNFESIDESKITDYLNNIFSTEIMFEKNIVKVKSKTIGILRVHESKNKPVVCLKNDGVLKEAEIYYRYNSRSEKIKYPELMGLFEQVKKNERKSWMEHFEKISKIGPENTAILDTLGGEISGKSGTLIIDKKLIPKLKFINKGEFKEGGKPVLRLIGNAKPVSISTKSNGKEFRITDNLQAPEVRLAEEEVLRVKYPLDYNELTKKLIMRYTDFVRNSKFHKLRKQFMKDENLCRTRYLDPKNLGGSKKDFYSPKILQSFDKHYTKKK